MNGKEKFCFFTCPAMTGNGIRYDGKGLSAKYKKEISKKAKNVIEKVEKAGFDKTNTKIIFAGADNLMIPGDFSRENIPEPDFPFPFINNFDFVKANKKLFWKIYKEEPWKGKISEKIIGLEDERLREFLKWSFPSKYKLSGQEKERMREGFVQKIFAGFVLDGYFLQQKLSDRILLEVENKNILTFQKLLWDFKSQKI